MGIDLREGSLKRKVFFIFFVAIIIFFIAEGIVYFGVFKGAIEKQEQFYAVKMAAKVNNIIVRVNNEVLSLCLDWSAWDSMYNAVTEGWTKSFEAEAFPPNSSFLFDINFVAILKGKDYVFSRVYNSGLLIDISPDFRLPESLIKQLIRNAESKPFDTFVKTSKGIMFVCINRITTSDGKKVSDGYLVMARFMSNSIWQKISDIILEDISFVTDNNYAEKNQYFLIVFHDVYLKKQGKFMNVVFPLNGFHNEVLGFVKIKIKREIFAFFYKSTIYSALITIGVFIFLVFLLILFFEKTLIRRIKFLAETINSIELGKKINASFGFHNDEIGVLEKSLVNMVNRISKQEKEREEMQQKLSFLKNMVTAGKVTYHIIHEINNPIRVIKNCLYAIENDRENQEEYYELLKKEINRLSYITQEMLDFSSSNRMLKEDIDLSFLIKDIIKTVKTAYRDKHIDINVVFHRKDVKLKIKGDSNKLKQVFINIIKNGLEASNFEKPIKLFVDLDNTKKNVIVSICDLGDGIDEAKVEKLFEPFHTDKDKGLGLGLSIAYNIIRNHKGLINVKPNKPKGACFEIVLPLKEDGDET